MLVVLGLASATPLPGAPVREAHAESSGPVLRLGIEYPRPGQEMSSPDGRGFVTGTAYQAPRALGRFDVYVAIDTSDSTKRPSGADVDGDGKVGSEGRRSSIPILRNFFDPTSDDPGDNVLACEIQAARTLLTQLDPESTRVGVIAFSGDRDPNVPDARIVAALSNDYAEVDRRLAELLEAGPQQETNLIAAVQLATLEFERAFLADRGADVQRLVLLISDGESSLPAALMPGARAQASIEAASDAAEVGVRIYTYAVGRERIEYLTTLEQIAAVTNGVYERVEQPADLIASFQNLDFAQIEAVRVENLTTGRAANDVLIDPYGTFAAMVELQPGSNTLEVFARSTSGAESRERVTVEYRRDDARNPLPARALERTGRLLREKMRTLLAEEIRRARRERRRIEIEIDR